VLALVIVGVVVVGGLCLKVALGIVIGTAVSGVLGGVFGGPFEKLPADHKQTLQQRVEAATGDRFKGLSDADASTRLQEMVLSGLPRLDDELLVEKVHLTTKMLAAADVPTCARLARGSGTRDADATGTALAAMDPVSVARWYDIVVSAIEAEAKGSPPSRTVATADGARVRSELFAKFSTSEGEQLQALYNGVKTSDAEACSAVRALYAHIEELPAGDLEVAALADVTP
jgi:hypothetical protein